MKNNATRKKIGLVVDGQMYLILALQMLYVFLGNTAHELLGVGFFFCLIIHVILKRRTVLAMLKKPKGTAFQAVTVLLVLCLLALMLSSMGVSRLLFPGVHFLGSSAFHRYLATAVLALSILHGGLHGLRRAKRRKTLAALLALGCAASVAVGLALIPYLNRHFKTVEIDYTASVTGAPAEWTGGRPLVVYFTRVGNTDFAEDVDLVSGASLLLADGEMMGNSQLLADMIADAVDCDVRAIALTGEKYPSSYNDTVSVAARELRAQARPGIEAIDVSAYDTVILVYPIWWGTVPMPVTTFLQGNDFTGKTLALVATQGGSGFMQSARDIAALAPGARVVEGISVYCDDIPKARQAIGDFLNTLGE